MASDWSRRSVLVAAGTVGATALTPTVSGRVTIRAVVPAADEFTQGEGYAGYFLHVGNAVDSSPDPQEFSSCGFSEWPPDTLEQYEGRLLDRVEADHRETDTELYVPANTALGAGTLWIVNREVDCGGEYVGLELEQVGAAISVAEETPSGAIGPGFGPLAAVGGAILGGLGVLRRRREE